MYIICIQSYLSHAIPSPDTETALQKPWCVCGTIEKASIIQY